MTISISSAQDTYPKLKVIEGDTVVLFQSVHLKYVNRKILEVEYLNEANKNLKSQNVSLNNELMLNGFKIESLNSQINSFQTAASAYSGIIQDKDKEINLIKKQNKKKRRNTLIISGGVGVVIGLIISILI